MLKSPAAISKPSVISIRYNGFIRYVRIGAFLHIMGLVGIALFFTTLQISFYYFEDQQFIFGSMMALLSFCFFTVPFFSEFDAFGRYQNYKQIKDAIYEMGYDDRLIKPFMHSKCQRDAVIVASEDLGYQKEVKSFFYNSGYRRYHILPDAFVKYPLVLFSKLFWKRILFTKHYQLKHFYW